MTAYAIMRGYMAVGGRADQSRAARIILKEFISVSYSQYGLVSG